LDIRCNGCFNTFDANYLICPHCGYVAGNRAKEVYCLLPGTELANRYIVGNVVGLGGFGIIYKAWDKMLEAIVAVKEYFPTRLIKRNTDGKSVSLQSESKSEDYRKGLARFEIEAQHLAGFSSHPNIVNLFEYFEEGGTGYIVMEFLDGVTLSQYMQQKNSQIDVRTAKEITLCVCYALNDMHRAGIIHRDISPENIIVCRNGMVKAIDLGAARFSSQDEADDLADIVVKPGYAPPEQYEKISRQGVALDIYALGATLYMMLTGVRPDESTNRIVNDKLPAPSRICPDVPEYLDGIVMKAMALEPQFRFRSMEHLRRALINGVPLRSVYQEKKRRRLTGYLCMVGILMLAATFTLLAIWKIGRDSAREPLPDGSITVWCISDGDLPSLGLERVIESFCEQYPNVAVSVEKIPEEHYRERFESAVSDGDLPDLFESTTLTDHRELYEDISFLEAQNANGSGQSDFDRMAVSEDGRSVAVGYAIPVIYVNTGVLGAPVSSIESLSSLEELCGEYTCAIDPASEALYEEAFGDSWISFSDIGSGFDSEAFISGQCPVLASDSAGYHRLIETIPGMFKMIR